MLEKARKNMLKNTTYRLETSQRKTSIRVMKIYGIQAMKGANLKIRGIHHLKQFIRELYRRRMLLIKLKQLQ